MLAVFIAGLMIGRTPEYLGKKIEVYEMKMVSIAILVTPILVLAGTRRSRVVAAQGKAGMANPGAHGFSEILYALTSAGNNNGSAFAGLSANTPFYNALLGLADVVRPLRARSCRCSAIGRVRWPPRSACRSRPRHAATRMGRCSSCC